MARAEVRDYGPAVLFHDVSNFAGGSNTTTAGSLNLSIGAHSARLTGGRSGGVRNVDLNADRKQTSIATPDEINTSSERFGPPLMKSEFAHRAQPDRD